jgi:DNA-binding MarR family transcriptional regulator
MSDWPGGSIFPFPCYTRRIAIVCDAAMTSTTNPGHADAFLSDEQLTVLLAHAISQPLKLIGQTEASLSCYAVFWSVAAGEGRTQVEIAKQSGLSAKTVSRVIAHLGESRRGLGWIRQVSDEDDRRLRRLILSRKGKALHSRMLKDLKKIG